MEPDDLYGLPLERFVPERAALAKALRGAGRRDEAAEVAKLRKPSAAAWAVNQLVRTQRDATRELFAAGDAVRAAQADVLAGRGDARALREAGARERDVVAGLVETARGLLGAEGHELSATTLERIADTLHAAALDDAARDEVCEGRLERELRHVGLGLGEVPAPGAATTARRGADAGAAQAPRPGTASRAGAGTQERADQLRAAKERAAAEAARVAARREARAALAKAAKAEERAGHALRAAEERRERAAAAFAQADAARDEARAVAEAAAEEHRRARAALEDA